MAFVFASALCVDTCIPVNSTPGLYVWMTFYRLFVAGVQALFMAVVPVINSDSCKIVRRSELVVGIDALIGSPVSGAITASNKGSYTGAQAFSESILLVGGLVVLPSREVKRRQDQKGFWTRM